MITTLIAMAIAPVPQVDMQRLLRCIREVEGHKWSDPGGVYAIQPITWRQHSRLPYRYASEPGIADEVAERHLAWLAKSLRADGVAVTAFSLGGCWRWGLEGFKRRMRATTLEGTNYAARVHNLYHAGSKK